jgi:hypothetical protein
MSSRDFYYVRTWHLHLLETSGGASEESARSTIRRGVRHSGIAASSFQAERNAMTRFELLHLLVGQARSNGFEFRRWYVGKLGLPWQNARQAVETLAAERRYYALLFSHEFACCFWKPGETMTFLVPNQTFTRRMKDGTIGTVSRKAYTRRSTREDAWLYHLKELAAAEEPLRYMRRYLRVEDELEDEIPILVVPTGDDMKEDD